MLKMPQQQYIRFLREAEGCSIQEIADRVGVHWRTAKKYADKEDWNEPVKKRNSRFPVMGPFVEIVDSWLEEDRLLPRKQRHTATRIYQRLRDEYGFTGSDRTVLNYVKHRKAAMDLRERKHMNGWNIRPVKLKRTSPRSRYAGIISSSRTNYSCCRSRTAMRHSCIRFRQKTKNAS